MNAILPVTAQLGARPLIQVYSERLFVHLSPGRPKVGASNLFGSSAKSAWKTLCGKSRRQVTRPQCLGVASKRHTEIFPEMHPPVNLRSVFGRNRLHEL